MNDPHSLLQDGEWCLGLHGGVHDSAFVARSEISSSPCLNLLVVLMTLFILFSGHWRCRWYRWFWLLYTLTAGFISVSLVLQRSHFLLDDLAFSVLFTAANEW